MRRKSPNISVVNVNIADKSEQVEKECLVFTAGSSELLRKRFKNHEL